MQNPTKYCQLRIVMKTGERLSGTYHVPIGTDASSRPADAIRKSTSDFMLLCDVEIEGSESKPLEAILVRNDAVAFIELPAPVWSIRDVAYTRDALAESCQSN